MTADQITSRTIADREYETAAYIVADCFASSRSYLYPDRPAWARQTLERAVAVLASKTPAAEDASFSAQLRQQLASEDDLVTVVFADTLVFYYLFPDHVRRETKVDRITDVLSWKNMHVPGERLGASFGNGIGRVGTHYLSAQHHVVRFFIQFALQGKGDNIDFGDARACERVADAISASTKHVSDARNALLHLIFPALYEPIVSQRHKQMITKRYALAETAALDTESALRLIRSRLSSEQGSNVSFYGKRRFEWDDSTQASFVASASATETSSPDDDSADEPALPRGSVWIEKTFVENRPDRQDGEYALGRMLWSPATSGNGADIYRFMRDVRPGDTVLHLTDNRAFTGTSVAVDRADHFDGLNGTEWADRPSLRVRLSNFRKLDPPLGREVFFEPPYGDRLVALRRSGQQNLFYTEKRALIQGNYLTPCPPTLLSILNDAYASVSGGRLLATTMPPEVSTTAPTPMYTFEMLLRRTLWTQGPLNELLDSLSAERARKQIILAGPPGTGKTWVAREAIRYLTGDDDARFRIVQFHPSYSYEQFVEGLRPEAVNSAISFRPVAGLLLDMASRSRRSADSHFLLLDEMNRANLPRVLGELLYLFEYRDSSIDLPYTRQFQLPSNLFFIGTMNTADRNIRSIDAALRRRFDIFECLPDRAVLERYYAEHANQVTGLLQGFDALNEALLARLDRHHTIGHTFFMAPVFTPRELQTTWDRQIRPLIEEYLIDQPDQLEYFTLTRFWPSGGA